MADKLQFRRVSGEQMDVEARVDDTEMRLGECRTARWVWLDDGTELRQHRVANALHRMERDGQRRDGYDQLDNEILAGRRLYDTVVSEDYPQEVACLYGDEATSADPYALFERYHGDPLSQVGAYLLDDEFQDFVASLLTGLCWVAAAGIAHRAINPDTVLWDSQRRKAQITDFSLCTVFAVPRTPVTGSASWVPMEQRPGYAYGMVGDRDDIWAAGKLIFYVRNQGTDLAHRGQLADSGLHELLDGVFGPPEDRPSASDLLVDRLGRRNPAPGATRRDVLLQAGRERFLRERERKHPGAFVPAQLYAGTGDGDRSAAAAGPATAANAEAPEPFPPPEAPGAPGAPGASDPSPASGRTRRFRWKRGD